MKYFKSPEANILFSTSILLEKIVTKAQKHFDDRKLSPEMYKELRSELLKMVVETGKKIEEIAPKYINKKEHQNKRKANAR